MKEQQFNSQIWLCGEIKHSNIHTEIATENQLEFLQKLQKLMKEYGINKVDVSWNGIELMGMMKEQ